MAAVLERQALGAVSTPITTGGTLATNTAALSAALSNAVSGTYDGYTRAIMTCAFRFSGGAPAANTGFSGWFLLSDDGAGGTYEDGDSTGPVIPARPADFVIPTRAVTTAQVVARLAELPPGLFKILLKNDATGATVDSGLTLKLTPITASYT